MLIVFKATFPIGAKTIRDYTVKILIKITLVNLVQAAFAAVPAVFVRLVLLLQGARPMSLLRRLHDLLKEVRFLRDLKPWLALNKRGFPENVVIDL